MTASIHQTIGANRTSNANNRSLFARMTGMNMNTTAKKAASGYGEDNATMRTAATLAETGKNTNATMG